jgi:hypothetical protein
MSNVSDIISKYKAAANEETPEDAMVRASNVMNDVIGEINGFLQTCSRDFEFKYIDYVAIVNELTIKYVANCDELGLLKICAKAKDTFMRREEKLHPEAKHIAVQVFKNATKAELEARKAEIKADPGISALCAYYKIENLEAEYRRYC